MTWKEKLRDLENKKQWDEAVEFMQSIIQNNPDNKDAYIFMNYLLMNLLVEEEWDRIKEKEYTKLLKWYFDESYAKFSNDAEYLYFTAITAVMSAWYFGIDVKDYEEMFKKANQLEPQNMLYQETYYLNLSSQDPYNTKLRNFATLALRDDSPIRKQLKDKGALGEYILGMQKWWMQNALDFMNSPKK